ncbi:MAG: late competence development ComFB family protein, partial [Selenomonadaceae bacterium]|nr:late competence development ComFB family protein [Selenomonadaceae bacterium]MBQ5586975.1 late competence development ComFB family protein [Selenomonadaceae bacterium]
LKPHYVSSDRGNLFERINTSDMMVKVDVLRAMTEAAEKVTRNPRHE